MVIVESESLLVSPYSVLFILTAQQQVKISPESIEHRDSQEKI